MTNEIDELIAILRQKPVDTSNDYEDPTITLVNSFIHAKSVAKSTLLVPASIIYDEFKMFTKRRVARAIFFNCFKRAFELKRVLGVTCYKVTPSSFGLPIDYSVYRDPRFKKKQKKLKPSIYQGVYPDPAGGFTARLETETGFRLLGHFYKEKEAAMEYDKVAKIVFGEKAILNFKD